MFPLGRLLETHHRCQASMTGYRPLNHFHHLSRGTVLEVPLISACFQACRQPQVCTQSSSEPSEPRPLQDWLPFLGSPPVGCDNRQLSVGPSGCWFPSGPDRKSFSSRSPPPATGPHSDRSRGRFPVLGDHYITQC